MCYLIMINQLASVTFVSWNHVFAISSYVALLGYGLHAVKVGCKAFFVRQAFVGNIRAEHFPAGFTCFYKCVKRCSRWYISEIILIKYTHVCWVYIIDTEFDKITIRISLRIVYLSLNLLILVIDSLTLTKYTVLAWDYPFLNYDKLEISSIHLLI